MDIQDWINRMERAGLFSDEQTLSRNEYLKVSGSVDTNLYFVVSGCLRVFVIDEVEEHTIRFGYQHNLIGALDSFITDQPSDFYIQALKKTVIKKVAKKDYLEFVHSSEENLKIWSELLGFLIFSLLEREKDILTSSPVERYKRVLKRSPQLFQEVPHKYIASYLRMTPETLSRIKKS
jgi:CRP-like cAMP-binding protein